MPITFTAWYVDWLFGEDDDSDEDADEGDADRVGGGGDAAAQAPSSPPTLRRSAVPPPSAGGDDEDDDEDEDEAEKEEERQKVREAFDSGVHGDAAGVSRADWPAMWEALGTTWPSASIGTKLP